MPYISPLWDPGHQYGWTVYQKGAKIGELDFVTIDGFCYIFRWVPEKELGSAGRHLFRGRLRRPNCEIHYRNRVLNSSASDVEFCPQALPGDLVSVRDLRYPPMELSASEKLVWGLRRLLRLGRRLPAKYFLVEPEGTFVMGNETIYGRRGRGSWPHRIVALHCELYNWMGDDFLYNFPCYVVTRSLGQKIQAVHLRGYRLAPVKVTVSDEFREGNRNLHIPEFLWLKITGMAGVDDFGIALDNRLLVSDRALSVLRTGNIQNCRVSDCPG